MAIQIIIWSKIDNFNQFCIMIIKQEALLVKKPLIEKAASK